jgi:hypothetical protein
MFFSNDKGFSTSVFLMHSKQWRQGCHSYFLADTFIRAVILDFKLGDRQ